MVRHNNLAVGDNGDFVLTDQLLTERFEQRYPGESLPCDAAGTPTS